MKIKNKLRVLAIVLLIGFSLISCINDDNTNSHQSKYFTVTFDADNNTYNTLQTVSENNKVIKPLDPIKIQAGLYTGKLNDLPNYTFNGWFNGDYLWDFDTLISENITLKAKWTAPQITPISISIENNIIYSVILYTSNNPNIEGYTFLLDTDLDIELPELNINFDITLIGIGEERIINVGTGQIQPLFKINNINANLIIGENITIKPNENTIEPIFEINSGFVSMLSGSKIIGALRGAVYIFGNNSTFKINGGEIIDGTYGGITIQMGILKIESGNFNSVSILENGKFLLSGNVNINELTLRANDSKNAKITLENDLNGTINTLNLFCVGVEIPTIINNWENKIVIDSSEEYNINASIINSINSIYFTNRSMGTIPQSINNTHKLELDNVENIIKLLVK